MLSIEKIRALRIRHGILQKELAELIDVPIGTWSNIELGNAELKEHIAERVEVIFDELGIEYREKDLPLPNHIRREMQDDAVNSPNHYANRKYEVIDVMQDTMTEEQFEGLLVGNIIKYIMRWDKKGSALQDLKKAKWYLNKLIETTTRGGNG